MGVNGCKGQPSTVVGERESGQTREVQARKRCASGNIEDIDTWSSHVNNNKRGNTKQTKDILAPIHPARPVACQLPTLRGLASPAPARVRPRSAFHKSRNEQGGCRRSDPSARVPANSTSVCLASYSAAPYTHARLLPPWAQFRIAVFSQARTPPACRVQTTLTRVSSWSGCEPCQTSGISRTQSASKSSKRS